MLLRSRRSETILSMFRARHALQLVYRLELDFPCRFGRSSITSAALASALQPCMVRREGVQPHIRLANAHACSLQVTPIPLRPPPEICPASVSIPACRDHSGSQIACRRMRVVIIHRRLARR